MKDFILYFLLLVLAGETVTLYLMNQEKTKEKVLAETNISTPTPTATPTPTPIPTPTPFDSPKPTAKAVIPQPKFTSQQINEFIDRFAGQYGVDPNVLRHIAICESSFNPLARQGAYAGLYQFGPITWRSLRTQIGEDVNTSLRYNAEEAVQTAAYAIYKKGWGIWPNCKP